MTDVLLATCSTFPEGEPGARLLVDAFADLGRRAAWAVWDDPSVDWSEAGLVAVRSTWDYAGRLPELLAWAEHVERWTRLVHPSSVLRWNTDKSYLLDLDGAGVPVVPTLILDDPAALGAVAGRLDGRLVVKPRVGAGGLGLLVLDGGPDLGVGVGLDPADGPWVVQPVVESVHTEGEVSVFVFDGVPVSQARKWPAGPEIRVHEHHGGRTEADRLDDEAALLATETVAATQQLLGVELAYARVDALRMADGRLVVSEIEVAEPGLYLEVLPQNAAAYAEAVLAVAGDPA